MQPKVSVRVHADARIQDLDHDGVGCAIRYTTPTRAGSGAQRLFGESWFPVCSPALARDAKRPLREPAGLRRHVKLQIDDPEGAMPRLSWASWLELAGVQDVRPAGQLTFSSYEQIVQMAIEGAGVAPRRNPLVRDPIRAGRLVAPSACTARPRAPATRSLRKPPAPTPEVAPFIDCLKGEPRRDYARRLLP